jgi:hypothetical protein
MPFYTSSPTYYTDPGDLNPNVTHAQADALVAAAAATWNVPMSSLMLTQGGALNEHVSSANTYFDGTQMVFPADVSASNAPNKPIAVIYDTDGSVIDTLMGQGASSPSGCRQTGAVESVDQFGEDGKIDHALIILNGRCVGSNPQQLLQMQYLVERAFGRVLGISWSQLNDNIFTGASPVPAGEIDYWPVMHPIDVLCSSYSYQCMTNPFQLRPDDISALSFLYPVTSSNLTPGKVLTAQNATYLAGDVLFPTGQGMAWTNIVVIRQLQGHASLEPWEIASGVTGFQYQQNGGNPVTGPEPDSANAGTPWTPAESRFTIQRVPNDYVENLFMVTEAINPLYVGEYAVGPYQRPPAAPSGSQRVMVDWSAVAGSGAYYVQTMDDAASSCSPGADGSQTQPAAADPTGWWTGLLCSTGHTSWWSAAVKAGRSWTVEVTALDESGAATMRKAQPVIGVWHSGDSGLPTVASQAVPMNTIAAGVTQLRIPAATAAGTYTLAVADQFGAGRPDFAYKARLLYADSVFPSRVSSAGGLILIAGEGFRQGNTVKVNGITATVIGWTANQIVARTPTMAAAGATAGFGVDVTVTDPATGGWTTISSGLTYTRAGPNVVRLVSAPTALVTGVTASTALGVRVYQTDGTTPVVSANVRMGVTAGSASLGSCGGGTSCVLQTDATGLAQTKVMGVAAGAVTLAATELTGGASVQVNLTDTDTQRSLVIQNGPVYVAAGATLSWTLQALAMDQGSGAAGVPVAWTAGQGLTLGTGANTTTDANGGTAMAVGANQLGAGSPTVTACAWTTVCSSWTVNAVDASRWQVAATTGAGQSVRLGTDFLPVTLQVSDNAGHPLQGAPVTVYQTVDAWEGGCAEAGRCPASPVLATQQTTAITDANGKVTITPLQVAGIPQTVNIVAVTGTTGFVSLSLVRTP